MKAYYYDGPVMPRQKRKPRAILLIGIKKKTA